METFLNKSVASFKLNVEWARLLNASYVKYYRDLYNVFMLMLS